MFSPLYNPSDYIPRIAAVHDLCGYGKCSLGVAIPVLSSAGCDVCPVPTALFSAHTLFSKFVMRDTTDFLNEYIQAWQDVEVEVDAIYSGFLSSEEQVDIIKTLYKNYPHALCMVDPVMGDNGRRYPTYTQELCDAMTSLACGADIFTPNLTEASIITGLEYKGQDPDDKHVRLLIDSLLNMGVKSLVLKGVLRGNKVLNYVAHQQSCIYVSNDFLPYSLHGTGDLYASCVLAAVMAGKALDYAAYFAGEFVKDSIKLTSTQPNFEQRGVQFEPLLVTMSQRMEQEFEQSFVVCS